MPKKERKKYGQFFTSMETARFMAGLYKVDEKTGKVSVLDAGAGSGILSCAFIERMETIDSIQEIELTCYENDENVLPLLKRNLEYCKEETKKKLTVNIVEDNYILQIAIALKAEKLVSMTDIAGLLRDKDDETTLIPEVEVSEIEGYKAAGIIAGGMIPKIGGMADAIYQGVHEAVIIDGRVPHSILLELFSNRGSGTRFYRRSHQE